MTELALFAGSFLTVASLGFQQKNIHNRRISLAIITATLIGGLNIFMLKLAPNASVSEMIAFVAGEPIGTAAALWLNAIWEKNTSKTC